MSGKIKICPKCYWVVSTLDPCPVCSNIKDMAADPLHDITKQSVLSQAQEKCPKCSQGNGHEAWCPDKYKGSALDSQVGGDHYKDCGIQPLEYGYANDLTICEHAVVKYITRHRKKGQLEDLKKAKHYIELEAKLTYGEDI